MMADYVQSIQLAPNGIVTEIYPEVGNEAGKIDLIPDETRGDIVNYGIDNKIVVMQGPFELKQGGFSMYWSWIVIILIRITIIFNAVTTKIGITEIPPEHTISGGIFIWKIK